MRIVLDTNVLVSGLLNPNGVPAQVLASIRSGKVTVLVDERILYEYRNVLRRKKFDFDEGLTDELIAYLDRFGEYIVADPLKINLPDSDDLPFLEVAVSGDADALVTGNKKDFSKSPKGVRILIPAEFLGSLQDRH